MINPIYRYFAWKTRRDFGRGDKKRDAGQTTPPEVIRFDDIVYGDDIKFKKWQMLDVYRPRSAGTETLEKIPVIVSVHGGAWVYGDKDIYQFYCMQLAKRGFAVVNYSYRLAPDTAFPSSFEDTEKVFQWIDANAQKYGFDLNNVFAVGDSAGGHLLGLYASALTNPEYAKNFPFMKPKSFKLKGVALNCGKYDMSPKLETNPLMPLLLKALLNGNVNEQTLDLVNASKHVTKDFPPAFVMTCIGDFLFSQQKFITDALEAAGVKYEYHCYGTKEEPLWHVFHCDPRLEIAARCNDDECEFFRKLSLQSE